MTELQKSKDALVRACQQVAAAKHREQQARIAKHYSPEGKAAWSRANAALTKALRNACTKANDFQADSGRNF